MTIRKILKSYPKIETDLLLSHILKKPKEFLYLNPEINLTTKQYSNFIKLVKRRQKSEPIAYLLGYKYFYGLKFKVTKDTLIPRPETELIVDFALGLIKNHKLKTILDIGTGSGCIAVTLAKNSKAKLTGSDVSKKALLVAGQNAKNNRASVRFVLSDLLDSLGQSFDLIIANLPYGWPGWKNNSSAETIALNFEPKQALFTKNKGLYQIQRLLQQISKLKKKPKFVLLEFDPRQKTLLSPLVKKHLPKASVKFHKDLSKRWRAMEIKL